MRTRIKAQVVEALGVRADELEWFPLAGGDTTLNFRVRINGTVDWVVKTDADQSGRRFATERDGLDAIRRTQALRVPMVHTVSTDGQFIILEAIRTRPMNQGGWSALGAGLARLHRFDVGMPYGWSTSNFIGPAVQHNEWRTSWLEFWREFRLEPQVKRAVDGHAIGSRVGALLTSVVDRLENWIPARVQPSLLRGDLWSGNALMEANGQPVLIDPAVSVGDREADLAMTHMFGGFPAEFYRAYDASFERPQGWNDRVEIYTLYHWLNHFNCFGSQYVEPVRRIAMRYGS